VRGQSCLEDFDMDRAIESAPAPLQREGFLLDLSKDNICDWLADLKKLIRRENMWSKKPIFRSVLEVGNSHWRCVTLRDRIFKSTHEGGYE
jgi:hypothetical protein